MYLSSEDGYQSKRNGSATPISCFATSGSKTKGLHHLRLFRDASVIEVTGDDSALPQLCDSDLPHPKPDSNEDTIRAGFLVPGFAPRSQRSLGPGNASASRRYYRLFRISRRQETALLHQATVTVLPLPPTAEEQFESDGRTGREFQKLVDSSK